MRIWVNGKARETEAESLAALLAEMGFADRRVATALNGEFRAAQARAGQALAEGDRVEIVSPMAGG